MDVTLFVEIDEADSRAAITHFYFKKWTATQIETELKEVHGDFAPALETIQYWINGLKRGHTSTARSGRPTEVSFEEMIDKIDGVVMEDGRIKLGEIAEMVEVSY